MPLSSLFAMRTRSRVRLLPLPSRFRAVAAARGSTAPVGGSAALLWLHSLSFTLLRFVIKRADSICPCRVGPANDLLNANSLLLPEHRRAHLINPAARFKRLPSGVRPQ